MATKQIKKKINMRRRILAAFSAVLFFSYLLTAVIFNISLRLFAVDGPPYQFRPSPYETAETAGIISRAGNLSIVLMIVMFVMAVVVSYFLSNSITRPIEKLNHFAQSIGHGDFTPNDFEFDDKELEDLNSALNKSVEQLGVYDSEQKDFFQNASHELRTPLMSIKVYAEGIVYDVMEPKVAAETILEETDKLSDLVTDLLYVAKIDNIATSYSIQEVDLIELIRDCASRHDALADRNQVNFVFSFDESSVYYNCVADLISRAVDNLISNAIRYAASEITLSCYQDGRNIIIMVADDGDGIEAKALPHVFERFFTGRDGNSGVGLSIVKSIAQQHKGRVAAENGVDGGAVFTITLST